MSWMEVIGTIKTRAGTSGTETFTSGARILQIIVVGGSGATMTVPNGAGSTVSVPMPASTPWTLNSNHLSRIMGPKQGSLNIVFASTVSYFIEYLEPTGSA